MIHILDYDLPRFYGLAQLSIFFFGQGRFESNLKSSLPVEPEIPARERRHDPVRMDVIFQS